MLRAFKTSLAFGLVAQFLFSTIATSETIIVSSQISTTDGVVKIARVQDSAGSIQIIIQGFDQNGKAVEKQEFTISSTALLERSNLSYPGVGFRRGVMMGSMVCGALLGGTLGDHSFQILYSLFGEGKMATLAAQYGETFGQVAGAILSFIGVRASTIGIDGTNSRKVIKTILKASNKQAAILKVPVTNAAVFDLLKNPIAWTLATPPAARAEVNNGRSDSSSNSDPASAISSPVSASPPHAESGN